MFKAIINTFSNCFKIPELKSRIFFTLVVLGVCRLVAYVRVPGIDPATLHRLAGQQGGAGGVMGLYGLFTGGALENCAVGALGIMPYISATIIVQLLTAVIPRLSKMAREENGRTKMVQYGRYLTVFLCLGQGFYFAGQGLFAQCLPPGLMHRLEAVLLMTTGTLLLMWLGEQITERGIGNGVSLVITIGIVARVPQFLEGLRLMFFPASNAPAQFNVGHFFALLFLQAGVIAGIIAITQAQRKVPVQYAQRVVGRKVLAGGTSFLPLRVNYANVMPIIFAQAILMFPQTIFASIANTPAFNPDKSSGFFKLIGEVCRSLAKLLGERELFYLAVFALLILFFSYFWVATQFNELQIADDLKKNGGYIPGVRPGQATSEYLHNAMSRITLAGAIFLTVIAAVPILLNRYFNVAPAVSQYFGGTSMLIMVGVLLDTMRQMESHLLMRHYDGFLKKGRLRGRF